MSGEPVETMEPWPGDALNRRPYALFLEKYIRSRFTKIDWEIPGSSFVVAIDAGWGHGKSFFVRRWQKDLSDSGHPVVFFDAWANDFSSDPLVGFLADLQTALKPLSKDIPLASKLGKDTLFSEAIKNVRSAVIPAGKVLAVAGLKKALGISLEEFNDLIDAHISLSAPDEQGKKNAIPSTKEVEKALDKFFEKVLEGHSEKKLAISKFRESFQESLKLLEKHSRLQLPLFIFIDELDRCRPNYAIELLEGIKHLFGVQGVCFVISINILQLSESVRAVYGQGFDARNYLRRFFDFEYQLPIANNEQFADQIVKELGADIRSELIPGLDIRVQKGTQIGMMFYYLATAFDLPLRDQKQVMKIVVAAASGLEGRRIYFSYLVFLAMLKHKNSQAFDELDKGPRDNLNLFNSIWQRCCPNEVRVPYLERNSRKTEVMAIGDVIREYHRFSSQSIAKIREGLSDINTHDYPRNLIIPVADEVQNHTLPEYLRPPSLSLYAQLVKFAGQLR